MPPDVNRWVDKLLCWRFVFFPEPLHILGEGPLEEGWRLSVVLLPFDGALRVAEIRVFPDGDRRQVKSERGSQGPDVNLGQWSLKSEAIDPLSPTITAQMLRSIRLPEIIRAVQEHWSSEVNRPDRTEWEQALGVKAGAAAAEFIRTIDIERRSVGRPRGNSASRRDVELATIATLYAEAVGEGSRSPIKDATAALGMDPKRPADVRRVRDAKYQAVERGYLTGCQAGRAAGVLTRRAKEILEEAALEEGGSHQGHSSGAPASRAFIRRR